MSFSFNSSAPATVSGTLRRETSPSLVALYLAQQEFLPWPPMLAVLPPHLCRFGTHQNFPSHPQCHFSINIFTIPQLEGASQLNMHATAPLVGTCQLLRGAMATKWTCDTRNVPGTFVGIQITTSSLRHGELLAHNLEFLFKSLSSPPPHVPHLVKRFLSCGSHFVFTKPQCF